MLKILQARLQQYMNRELPDIQAGFRKGRETEIKFPISIGSLKKQESFRKTSTSALLTMPKPLTVWTTTNRGKFFKRRQYPTTWPAPWEICMQIKEQQLELEMEQQTGSKSGKEYFKAAYSHCLFNLYADYIMQNAGLNEAQAGIKIAGRNINNLTYADDTTLMVKAKKN